LENTFTEEKIAEWERRLAKVFNRGFWNGYYLGQRLGEWSAKYGSSATHRKVYIGKGVKYFPKIDVAEFLVESQSISVGDELLITGPTTGVVEFILAELRIDGKPAQTAKRGDRISFPLKEKIRANDKLFKWEKSPLNPPKGDFGLRTKML
jgi:putative protease